MSTQPSTSAIDQRRKWSFAVSEASEWTWTITFANGTQQSSGPFPTLKECSADAQANGYIAHNPEEERRRALKLRVAEALRRE